MGTFNCKGGSVAGGRSGLPARAASDGAPRHESVAGARPPAHSPLPLFLPASLNRRPIIAHASAASAKSPTQPQSLWARAPHPLSLLAPAALLAALARATDGKGMLLAAYAARHVPVAASLGACAVGGATAWGASRAACLAAALGALYVADAAA